MKKLGIYATAGLFAATAASAEHHEKGDGKMMEAPELTGAFASEDGFVGTFLAPGYLVVADGGSGVAGIVVKYGAKDGVIWFKDLTPPPDADEAGAECAMSNKGKYNYAEEDGVLTFSLIEDPCAGRVEAVTGVSLTRMEMPEPAEAMEE